MRGYRTGTRDLLRVTVVAVDGCSDLALVDVEGVDIPPLSLASSAVAPETPVRVLGYGVDDSM